MCVSVKVINKFRELIPYKPKDIAHNEPWWEEGDVSSRLEVLDEIIKTLEDGA
jgi:hypothetical protein